MNRHPSIQRKLILENVVKRHDHPTAGDVYEDVRRKLPRISLGTVYRNLKSLAEGGLLQEIELGDGSVRYDGNLAPHYHFTCESCGSVADVPHREESSFVAKLAKETGLSIRQVRVELFGVCGKCEGRRAKKPPRPVV
jgi:Fe2+ or Zn2+ uptake regulation protein